MPVEVEMKLAIPDDETANEIFSDAAINEMFWGEPKTTHMLSRYYDTTSGSLSARRWTLRLRREGDRKVVTCKTASVDVVAGLFSRGEWQVYADDVMEGARLLVEEGAPSELLEEIERDGVVERCTIEFDRRAVQLKLPAGVIVDMSVDKGVIKSADRERPLHELELELLFGRPEDLQPISELLVEKYHLQPERLSKYARALELELGRPVDMTGKEME